MSQDDRVQFCTALCEQLYNPKSSQERDQAQKILEYQFPTFADETGSGIAGNSNNLSSRPLPAGMENRPTFVINTPTDTASALKLLLETSPNPYVQTFSLARLKQLIISQFSIFDDDTKIQLRKVYKIIIIILILKSYCTGSNKNFFFFFFVFYI